MDVIPSRGTCQSQPALPDPEDTLTLFPAATLPDTLAAGFDAFEVIRLLARDREDRVSRLLAAFMTAAGAAVDGREAITAAPALPQRARPLRGRTLFMPWGAPAGQYD